MRLLSKITVALVRIILGFMLIYVTIGLAWTVVVLPADVDRHTAFLPTVLGFGIGLALFIFGVRFLSLYVFGHELTHWLAAKCFRRETGAFRFGAKGGSVEVEKPNVWIVLAPYFMPIYTVLWIGGYGVFRFCQGLPGPTGLRVFHAGLGFTYAFHVVLTAHALLWGQKDIREYGRFYSIALVFFCNVALFFSALATAAGQWRGGIALLRHHLVVEGQTLVWCWNWLFGLF